MLHNTVFNTSQICQQLGVNHAVISPGSRNAPLIISFARNEKIKKHIIPDERSAGFIALGIAQALDEPVALICTSGTAMLNYAPAIAEAYYRQIPLLVLSADRPPELIDQRDGQTIRQIGALENHVKVSFQLPIVETKTSSEEYIDSIVGGISKAIEVPAGPVHFNIPFREPFYPTDEDVLAFQGYDIHHQRVSKEAETRAIDIPDGQKILILIGQQKRDDELNEQLAKIDNKIPVLFSPLNNIDSGIRYADAFLKDQEELKPDILITSGLSILSKNLKEYLRNHKPEKHFHFDPSGVEVDTYQTEPDLIRSDLKSWLEVLQSKSVDEQYLNKWEALSEKSGIVIEKFMSTASFSETKAAWYVLNKLPEGSTVHLSNSMPVRFADLFGVPPGINVYSNRGTSGIDGCTSTALGTSLVTENVNVLITGDLAFLYDRNAFFHNYQLPNLRVIILNNGGGGIFRLINGPSRLKELDEYFETRHQKTAEYICMENNLEYKKVVNEKDLMDSLEAFWYKGNQTKVMEIFSDPKTNQSIYSELRNYINEQINN